MGRDFHWLDRAEVTHLAEHGCDAFRAGGDAHAWVDWWAGEAVISASSVTLGREWEKALPTWEKAVGLRAERVWFRQLVPNPDGGRAPALWRGSIGESSAVVVREYGCHYRVHPGGGYSAGLFPDQRENRMFLQQVLCSRPEQHLQPPRVLNLFAYTGAFSVAAARAGALTLSVDVSSRYLAWGRENFQLNGLAQEGHRWWKEDVLKALPRLRRRGESFDAVILDPPTFSRNRQGRVFRLPQTLPAMVEDIAALLLPGGWLLLSTNSRDYPGESWRKWASRWLPAWRQAPGKIPPDFLHSSCSSTVWLQKP